LNATENWAEVTSVTDVNNSQLGADIEITECEAHNDSVYVN